MTFKPAIWYPVSVVLSAVNLAAAGFAAGSAEPWHAGAHVALAVAFGAWARRLQKGPSGSEGQARLEAIDALEVEVSDLRQELSEAQERLDFAERLLAQGLESRRVDPHRQGPTQPGKADHAD
jgi:hypothetical protein